MTLAPIFVEGTWSQAVEPEGRFQARDPARGVPCGESFPVSGTADVDRALQAGVRAVEQAPADRADAVADLLQEIARGLDADYRTLAEMAHRETGLGFQRFFETELPRTVSQLRRASEAARDRSWCLPTLDPDRQLRSCYRPLAGPVAIIGPGNFPLAFNPVGGGDFATAIAAGNPVIAKGHPGHPGTTRLLARIVASAVADSELPDAWVQVLYDVTHKAGLALARDSRLGALAFTGGRSAGRALERAAREGGNPVYLEMGSLNPVFFLPGVVRERPWELARELFDACMSGAGQFCTRPGLAVAPAGPSGEMFLQEARRLFRETTAGPLLSPRAPRQLVSGISLLREAGVEVVTGGEPAPDNGFQATLLRVRGAVFLRKARALQRELFGPATLLVQVEDDDEMIAVARHLEGSLAGSIYSQAGGRDEDRYRRLEPVVRARVGRLLNDRMPTGVTVSPAMNHGGPWPAAGHPGFTAVGIPASIRRFAALQCYDHVRPDRLPPELADENPTGGTWRLVDGTWTCDPLG